MPIKPTNNYSGPSASAVDGDNHVKGADAADNELQKIEDWSRPSFAGGGRHQSQLDPEFGFKERKPR
jgi:hypothetical protein